MTPEEHGLLEPVEGDYCKVQCKVCDKKMSKRSVFAHLKQHHPEFVEASWEWVVKKDYNLMKTRRQNLIKIHLSQILGPTMLQVMKHHQNQMMQRNNWLFTMQPQQHQCLTKRKLPHHPAANDIRKPAAAKVIRKPAAAKVIRRPAAAKVMRKPAAQNDHVSGEIEQLAVAVQTSKSATWQTAASSIR